MERIACNRIRLGCLIKTLNTGISYVLSLYNIHFWFSITKHFQLKESKHFKNCIANYSVSISIKCTYFIGFIHSGLPLHMQSVLLESRLDEPNPKEINWYNTSRISSTIALFRHGRFLYQIFQHSDIDFQVWKFHELSFQIVIQDIWLQSMIYINTFWIVIAVNKPNYIENGFEIFPFYMFWINKIHI